MGSQMRKNMQNDMELVLHSFCRDSGFPHLGGHCLGIPVTRNKECNTLVSILRSKYLWQLSNRCAYCGIEAL